MRNCKNCIHLKKVTGIFRGEPIEINACEENESTNVNELIIVPYPELVLCDKYELKGR